MKKSKIFLAAGAAILAFVSFAAAKTTKSLVSTGFYQTSSGTWITVSGQTCTSVNRTHGKCLFTTEGSTIVTLNQTKSLTNPAFHP